MRRSTLFLSVGALLLIGLTVASGGSASTPASGTKLWLARYNGPASRGDYGFKAALSSDGTKLFVTGQSYGGATTGPDYATLAYQG
jgi:hypothetical protein